MKKQNRNYFVVEARCGHVGRNNYISKFFPTMASSRKEAAQNIRNAPRVKHNDKFAIINCFEVSFEDYLICKANYLNDPYFKCHNHQEQEEHCPLIADSIKHMPIINHFYSAKEDKKENNEYQRRKEKEIMQYSRRENQYLDC
ncbi:MAG: hypothetical protein WCR56_00525 [Bacilli bacterium]|jgi:hypothetical protein